MSFYKENKKGDLEVARQLGVKLPKWESQYERLYTDTKDCLKNFHTLQKKVKNHEKHKRKNIKIKT